MKIQLDMYQTIAVAVVVLMLGKILEALQCPGKILHTGTGDRRSTFCNFTCICYATGIAEFEFDDILKEVCMVFSLHL